MMVGRFCRYFGTCDTTASDGSSFADEVAAAAVIEDGSSSEGRKWWVTGSDDDDDISVLLKGKYILGGSDP
jgi:hypothetical protein